MTGERIDTCGALRAWLDEGAPDAERFAASVHPSLAAIGGEGAAWSAFLAELPTLRADLSARRALLATAAALARAREPDAAPPSPSPPPAPERFAPEGHPFAGGWLAPPVALPADLDPAPIRRAFGHALRALPAVERIVIVLRDVERWPREDVCHVLALRDTEERMALHRARLVLRSVLEAELAARAGGGA